jgi:polyphosphate kinase 2 (PPK2 family)
MDGYERALTATSTRWAPWYVVPGDHKWARDIAVATILVDTFEQLCPQIPDPEPGLEGLVVE